jgi:hypothetical protein
MPRPVEDGNRYSSDCRMTAGSGHVSERPMRGFREEDARRSRRAGGLPSRSSQTSRHEMDSTRAIKSIESLLMYARFASGRRAAGVQ